MTMTNDWMESLNRSLRWAVSLVLKVVLSLAGLVFMAGALVLGVTIGLSLLVWALLQGRRPSGLRFGVPPGGDWRRFRDAAAARRAGAAAGRRPTSGDQVVDIEAREVVDPRRQVD